MTQGFDYRAVASMGWRQGAILGQNLASLAWEQAPEWIEQCDLSRILVTTHDCDILNGSISKEPIVELLRARMADYGGPRRLRLSGRNPRALMLPRVSVRGHETALEMAVHDRWTIPRKFLMDERPAGFLEPKDRRLVAEWLAKRYIRSAFPTAFDHRWRRRSKKWRKLLAEYASWIQGVYIRLNTQRELTDDEPYRCSLLLAVPHGKAIGSNWIEIKDEIERAIGRFWSQLSPAIECVDCRVVPTNRITLADIETHQRFDADWVSFEDDSAVTPLIADFRN